MRQHQEKKDPQVTLIRYVKGVGPKRAAHLSRLGIETVEDLLTTLPRRYEDRSSLAEIRSLRLGEVQTTVGTILSVRERKTRKGLSIVEANVSDGTGALRGLWFNQPYLKYYFSAGQKVVLHGKVEQFHRLQMNQPEHEIIESGEESSASLHVGRIVPIYPLTSEISQRWLRSIVHEAIIQYSPFLADALPRSLQDRYHLMQLEEAVRAIHFPNSKEDSEEARRKLAFNEFFLFGLSIAFRRTQNRALPKHRSIQPDLYPVASYERLFPFPFTAAQRRVIEEIRRDMENPVSMNRLLQGDVGSGKTLVVMYAMVLAVKHGWQAAFMAPTEILAEQHKRTLSTVLAPLKIRVAGLVGGMSSPERKSLLRRIERGEVDIVVGTHALIEEGVRFKELGIAVVDEQHKFGVIQRARLRQKGQTPDVLVMTATPIPRTLALTLYGDLDVSVLNELPPGRTPVETRWVEEGKRGEVYDFLRGQLQQGRQAYVVYPLVEESEKLDLLAATEMAETLRRVFSEFTVGLLHGRMKREEKEALMRTFREGTLSLLVSTIVVEVGIDVPNATVMVIEHGERFGLSQLHQLRGRIGRTNLPSHCFLISDAKTDEAKKRLSILVQTRDGFRIAEEDLLIRGPGEFFGKRQHGLPELKIGNIVRDIALLEQTKKEALQLLEEDPKLLQRAHQVLRRKFIATFKMASEWVATP
ncbi:MAG: ATP-dependent DNA helicase RecG [Candidatus Omnitrophota bacterium]